MLYVCPVKAGCSTVSTAVLGFLLAQALLKKSYWCDFVSEGNDYFTCRAKANITCVGAAAFLWPVAHSAFSARLSSGGLHARVLQ